MTKTQLKTAPLPSAVQSALRTLQTEQNGLADLAHALGSDQAGAFAAAIALLVKAKGRIIITGMGKSGHVGRKIAATLASTGTPAYYVHPAEASHGDLGMIQTDDAILALSWSGETVELADIISYSRRFGVGLVAVTANADSTLAVEADVALVLPKATEACPNGLAPTTSTTMQIALGDAIAVALLEERGFTALDFRMFHPGGKLGARLKLVRDCMHGGDELPLATPKTLMSEAIVTMSAKGFGCVIVRAETGGLAGIITDGDLRRHMQADLMTKTVEAVMTNNPLTISADMLAVEALEMMEKSKRSALIVVEAGKPVGLIRVLDLLQIGVA
jgi:arabinose-5-phosphate isomerase